MSRGKQTTAKKEMRTMKKLDVILSAYYHLFA